jgi:hypothetical protein
LIDSRYVLKAKNEVGFELGSYDSTQPLIIDPVLVYSTFLTGNYYDESIAIAVDSAGSAYVTGFTFSSVPTFPTTTGAYKTTCGTDGVCNYNLPNGGTTNIDAFVTKFTADGSGLVYSTYLGGSYDDAGQAMAVDSSGNAYVTGYTRSADFPTTTGAFQTTCAPYVVSPSVAPPNCVILTLSNCAGGASDGRFQPAGVVNAFVTKLNPTGTALVYSTFLGGTGNTNATGIALNAAGQAYIAGSTDSPQGQPGYTLGSCPAGYSTGHPTTPSAFMAGPPPPATPPPNSPNPAVLPDAVFSVLSADGTSLVYSTYLGGTGADIGYGIAVDSSSAYVTGSTTSTDFPAAGAGVFQSTHGNDGGKRDAFLAKLANPVITGTTAGSVTLSYFTYIGGNADDVGLGVAVDTIQGARVTGWTASTDIFPLNSNVQVGPGGANDAFVARIDTTATAANAPGHYFTYLGGVGNDYGTSIAVDPQGASYVAGETASANFPLANPFQPALSGNTDAFLTKLGPLLSLSLTGSASPSVVGVGNQASFEYTITNTGDSASGIVFTDSLPTSGASFTSASVSSGSGSCGGATGGFVTCSIGTLNAGAIATVTVVLTPTPSTTPSTTAATLGNSASVTASGCAAPLPCNVNAAASVTVNDFNVSVSPASATVPAGVPATYTATVTPTGNIPESVSIACSSGLPTGATCTATTNPFPSLSSGPMSTVLVISTTARVTTTTRLWRSGGPFYALWLPVSGLALLGVGMGSSRKRHLLTGLLVAGCLSFILFQPACGSTAPVTTTTGTPAGTYLVTVAATSGTATRNATVTLTVQ